MKKISVIVPIYNVEEYLEECLNSIVNQTYKNLEIILVNDGSKDKSIDIVNKYSKKDGRIRVLNKYNGGLSSARNEGLLNATGEYIFHVDGDDFIDINSCEKLIKKAVEDDLDIVIGDIKIFSKNEERIWQDNQMASDEVIDGKSYLKKYYFLGKGTNSVCNKLIRKELYNVGEISHPLTISLGEDGATLPKLILKAKKIGKIESSIYNYRHNVESMTKKRNKKIREYKEAFEIVKEYFYKNEEKKLFDKYSTIFKFNLYYAEVMVIPFKVAKHEKLEDYLMGWRELKEEISLILEDEFINSLSVKRRALLRLYNINIYLGDMAQLLRDNLKNKN